MLLVRTILAKLYYLATTSRNFLFDRKIFKTYKSSLPVVSIGNISVGGSGKTPLSIALADFLIKKGLNPAVVSRGYKGSLKGPVIVNINHQPSEVGDEPLLIFQRLKIPVVVSKNKVKGAKFIEENKLGDLIILDDGFQHRWLERDVDIVCINVDSRKNIEAFIGGQLLPLGLLRESRDAALVRSDIIVLNHRSQDDGISSELDKVTSNVNHKCIFNSHITPFFPEHFNKELPIAAFCGIANSDAFFKTLRSMNLNLVAELSFPDHYFFTEKEILDIQKKYNKAQLICTEKDWVKIRSFNLPGVSYLAIDCKVSGKMFELIYELVSKSSKV